ncbi:MAG: PilZ domain-containing protein [Myxococcaceae bacterium]
MTGTVDRRIEARRSINHEFSSVEQFISEYVINMSRSGVFIKSDDPLPIGTHVNLKFTVILDDLETIEGIGEVVRVVHPDTPGQTPGMGVVFVELTQISKDLIERILVRR